MELKTPSGVFVIYTAVIIGTIFFVYGFFSFTPNSDGRAKFTNIPTELSHIKLNSSRYVRHVSNVVLMVVDALRYDFVSQENMRYVSEQLTNENACMVQIKVDVPTVTMPRIKSITSGTISSFIDVVLNLGSTKVSTDSIIHQMYDRGDKIVFYGDNVWTKLFPNLFYRKQENFDSFYVNDFYTGDKNITRNLSGELRHPDWDAMILHYLGLDHIGHVEGSFSPKIIDKLNEMDRVVQQIHTSMNIFGRSLQSPPLLLVTSDHGMRDTGGHGGSSHGEVYVPLIMLGSTCSTNSTTSRHYHNQIDIAPTLAILLGIPIPEASIGCIITEAIDMLDYEDQLFALYYNVNRLLTKAIVKFGTDKVKNTYYFKEFELAINYHAQFLKSMQGNSKNAYFKMAKVRYKGSCAAVSDLLSSSFTHFDMLSIVLGIFHTTYSTVLLCFLALCITSTKAIKKPRIFANLAISCALGIFIRFFICYTFGLDSKLCKQRWYTSVVAIVISCVAYSNLTVFRSLKFQCFRQKPYIFIVMVLHAITLFSSSFIEEEHQTWYYITTTSLLLLFICEIRCFKLEEMQTRWTEAISNFLRHKKKNTSFTVISGYKKSESLTANLRKIDIMINYAKSWGVIFVLLTFVRRLNQTGDKWLSNPDVGDWFTLEEHKFWLSLFFFLSLLALVFVIKDYNGLLTNILNFTAIILIYHYRTISGSVLLFDIKQSSSKTSLILFWVNILEIIAINYLPTLHKLLFYNESCPQNIKNCLGANLTAFSLISVLLHKPHNAILVPVCLLCLEMCYKSCDKLFREQNAVMYKTVLSYWIGKAFFFYQGNSNNLASIDLNPGYIGLDSYNPIIVSLFVTINTYSGPICCFVSLLHNIFNESDLKKNGEVVIRVISVTSLIVIFPLTMYLYVITMLRSHLFVWTVFSPKVLYECFNTYLFYSILMLTFLVFKFVKVF